MRCFFAPGEFVRVRRSTRCIYEVVRILPILDHGTVLYVISNKQNAEMIVKQHQLMRA
jgi:hypothetical protein